MTNEKFKLKTSEICHTVLIKKVTRLWKNLQEG